MLIEEMLTPTRVHHYSDEGMMIRQVETGILYEDAVDNVPCKYIYEETDEPIPEVEREGKSEHYNVRDHKINSGTQLFRNGYYTD